MPTKRINIETYLEIWSLPTEMLTSKQTRFSNVFMSDDFSKACVLLNEKKKNELQSYFWIVYSLLSADKTLKKHPAVMYTDDVLY